MQQNPQVLIVSLNATVGSLKELLSIGEYFSKNNYPTHYWLNEGFRSHLKSTENITLEPFHFQMSSIFKKPHEVIQNQTIINMLSSSKKTFILFYTPNLSNPIYAKALKKINRQNIVCLFLHDPWKTNIKAYGFKKGIYFKLADIYQRWAAKYFDIIFSPSIRSQSIFKSYYRIPNQISILAPLIVPESEDVTCHKNNIPTFAMMGRYNPARGYDHFINLVRHVAKHDLPYHFKWIASPNYSAEILNAFTDIELKKLSIVNKNPLLDSDIDNTLRECHGAFRFDKEITQSGVVPVVFKNKIPVIVTNHPGFTQFIQHKKNGIVLPDNYTPPDILSGIDEIYNNFDQYSKQAYQSYLDNWHPNKAKEYFSYVTDWLDHDNLIAENNQSITLICQLYYPELISTGQVMTELMSEIAKSNIDTEVICGYPSIKERNTNVPPFILHQSVRIRRLFSTRFPKLNILFKLCNQISFCFSLAYYLLTDKRKSLLVLSTDPPFISWVNWACQLFKKRPHIQIIFDVYPDTLENFGLIKKNGIISKLFRKLNLWAWSKSEAIIVIGRCMENRIILNYPDLKPKIHTIPLWSQPDLLQPIPKSINPLVKKYELENKFVILYSGNMGRFHALESIMEAAKELQKETHIIFLFIGEGYKKKWMLEFTKNNNLTNCIFSTYVQHEELAYSMGLADLALVSLDENQYGLSVPSKTFGYMAAGKPILATIHQDSEISKVIQEENCGITLPPPINGKQIALEIKRLSQDSHTLKKLGENGRKASIRKYNLQYISEKYIQLISKLSN